MSQLTRNNSPLAQVNGSARVRLVPARLTLSRAEEAILRRVLDEKYEYIPSEVYELPDDEAQSQLVTAQQQGERCQQRGHNGHSQGQDQ